MRGQIAYSQIGFGLHDHASRFTVYQDAAQQNGSELNSGPFKKFETQPLRGAKQ